MSEENVSFEQLLNDSMKESKKLEKITEGTVINVNDKGEVFVDLNYKADGIIPKSEYSFDVNADPKKELKAGDKITVQVLKLNDGEGNVLLSYKKIRNAENKKKQEENMTKFWEKAEVGNKYEGTVSSICSYGAFIDIDGVQGLLHISEISWNRDAKVGDILKEGQKINITIKELDKENKRMKLSYDEKGEDPWNTLEVKVGDIVKVTIKKMMPFGAFAEIKEGIEGLIHISQISTARITKPEDVLSVGEEVNAKIIDMDIENKKIELSIRELEGTSDEYSSQDNDKIEQ